MKCTHGLFLLSLISSVSYAQDCRTITPSDYLVFSAQDILATNSDFQGLTGAGRDAAFSSYAIHQSVPGVCEALVVGRDGAMFDGSIGGGNVEAGHSFRIEDGGVSGKTLRGLGLPDVGALSTAAEFFAEKSMALTSLRATDQSEQGRNGMLLDATHALSVFTIPAEQFTASSVVTILGSPDQLVVINLRGSSVTIGGMDIEVEGGIRPEQIIFNFPETTSLTITASGSKEYGIPGTVLAPAADTHFYNDRITGGLYVRNLEGDGQVNYAKTRWPEGLGN